MSDIDEIKQRLNITDIVGERVTLKKAGRNFKGLCPFHHEKTPSFMVSPERGTFHCFGCGKGGSVIDFVMEYEHIDFIEALEQLAERAGVKLTKLVSDSPEQKLKETLYEINQLAGELYTYILLKHPLGEKARMYLKNRGISDKSIKTFGLGYSPNSWDALLKFLRKKGYEDRLIEQAGLIVRSQKSEVRGQMMQNAKGSFRPPTSEFRPLHFYDRFRGRVMFTLRDHRGNVVGFSGRVLVPSASSGQVPSDQRGAKYINTSETPVYSKSHVLYGLDVTKGAIAKAGEAICMEGELDLISSFQAGVGNVVAIKGSALTEGHVHLLKRFTKTLVFCLDSDAAGDAASRRGMDIAEREGLEMKAIVIPSGKDPDEAVREDPIGFKKAVERAIPIYDFFLTSLQKRYDLNSPTGKKKAGAEFLPIIFRMTNAIVQGHYIKKIAQLLGVSEEYVDQEMRKTKVPFGQDVKLDRQDDIHTLTRQEKIELYTLALLLQGKTLGLWNDVKQGIVFSDLSSLPVRRIFEALELYIKANKDFSIPLFVQTVPPELLTVFDQAYLWDISEITDDDSLYYEEWKKTIRELKRTIIRQKIQTINKEVSVEEDPTLQGRLSELTRELSLLEKSAEA